MKTVERFAENSGFENDAEVGARLLEYLQPDSPERQLVEWLNRGLLDPEILTARYFHYEDLSRQANEKIHARYDDKESIWLQNNYYIPVGVFYWSMETYCHNMHPKMPAKRPRKYARRPFVPEFTLDNSKIKERLITDEDQRKAAVREHEEHTQRIRHLCDYTLDKLPEEARAIYSVPLHALASAHKNVAFCAEFSRFMLYN